MEKQRGQREGGSGQVLDKLSLRYLGDITHDMSNKQLDVWISVRKKSWALGKDIQVWEVS